MLRSKSLFHFLASLLFLGACSQPPVTPEPLDFATDPRILRGIWVGEETSVEGSPLLLYLKASAPTQDSYQITGFFQQGFYSKTNVTGTITVPLTEGLVNTAAQQASECSGAVFAQSQSARNGVTEYELCGTAPTGSPPQFDLTLTQRSDTGHSDSYTYSMTRQPNELADPNLLVHGKLVYAQDESSKPFEFTKDSHAIVQLWWWTGLTIADVEPELLASTTVESISSFPIEYRLEGDAEETFARRGEYYLNVGVFSGDGGPSGEKFSVGDLTDENTTIVPKAGAEVNVELTRLEACDSPAADGACIPTSVPR